MTSTSDTSTYFVVYTVEGDFASVSEIVDAAIHTDPPTEAPTIAELRDRIIRSVSIAVHAVRTGSDFLEAVFAAADEIVETVTLGNVPAGEVGS